MVKAKKKVECKSVRSKKKVELKNDKLKKKTKSSTKKKKRIEKDYSVHIVEQALEAIKKGKSLREAASTFGVPKSTLFRKLKNGAVDCKKGAPTILTEDEESDIVKWILYCAERGLPVTKKHLLDTVKKYVMDVGRENLFKDNQPGYKWYKLFMKRHPNLSIRTAQNLTSTRASVSEIDLRQWFAKLKMHLEEKNLLNLNPKQVYNLDESSFMLVPPNNDEVIAKKGAGAVYKLVGGSEKGNLTVLITAAVSGELLPPMILFDLKTTPRKEVLEKIPKDWAVGNTEKGWMVSDSFYKYVVNVFHKWLVDKCYCFPVVLYADNHSSHLTMNLMKFCKEKQIELIGLYPNATHLIQPLDVSVFHVLKEKYREANASYRIQHNIVDIKKHMFAEIFKIALDSYDFSKCIINGFKACGLVPFNPDAVRYNILNKNKKKNQYEQVNAEQIRTSVKATSDNDFLQKFEKEVLSPSILEEFRRNECKDSWTGDVKLEALFESWRKLKNKSDNFENQEEQQVYFKKDSLQSDVCEVVNESNEFNVDNLDLNDCTIIVIEEDLSKSNSINYEEPENFLATVEIHPDVTLDNVQVQENCLKEITAGPNESVNPCVQEISTGPSKSVSTYPLSLQNTDDNAVFELHAFDELNSSFQQFTTEQTISDVIEKDSDKIQEHGIPVVKITENLGEKVVTNQPLDNDQALDTSILLTPENSSSNSCLEFSSTPKSFSETSSHEAVLENENKVSSENINEKLKDVTSKDLNLSSDMRKALTIPEFTPKKKKTKMQQITVNTVDTVLKSLQEKKNEKILKQNQILLNKRKKEENRAKKEKEQSITKSFQEKKTRLNDEKRDLTLQIKALKKTIKDTTIKENKVQLQAQIQTLIDRSEEINREILDIQVQTIQTRIKIKKEKL